MSKDGKSGEMSLMSSLDIRSVMKSLWKWTIKMSYLHPHRQSHLEPYWKMSSKPTVLHGCVNMPPWNAPKQSISWEPPFKSIVVKQRTCAQSMRYVIHYIPYIDNIQVCSFRDIPTGECPEMIPCCQNMYIVTKKPCISWVGGGGGWGGGGDGGVALGRERTMERWWQRRLVIKWRPVKSTSITRLIMHTVERRVTQFRIPYISFLYSGTCKGIAGNVGHARQSNFILTMLMRST